MGCANLWAWGRSKWNWMFYRPEDVVLDGVAHPIDFKAMMAQERLHMAGLLRTEQGGDRSQHDAAAVAQAVQPLAPVLNDQTWRGDDPHFVGLALSGGGIRSATFNLGVVQVLADQKVLPHVHYLSTVSGGGFLGSCLTSLGADGRDVGPAFAHVPYQPEPAAVRRLRQFSRYLAPGGFMEMVRMGAIWLSGLLSNLLPVMAALGFVATLGCLVSLMPVHDTWFFAKLGGIVMASACVVYLAFCRDSAKAWDQPWLIAMTILALVGIYVHLDADSVFPALAWACFAMVTMAFAMVSGDKTLSKDWVIRNASTMTLTRVMVLAAALVLVDVQQVIARQIFEKDWSFSDLQSWFSGGGVAAAAVAGLGWAWGQVKKEDKLALGGRIAMVVALVIVPVSAWLGLTALLHMAQVLSPVAWWDVAAGLVGRWLNALLELKSWWGGLKGLVVVAGVIWFALIIVEAVFPRPAFKGPSKEQRNRWRTWYNRGVVVGWCRILALMLVFMGLPVFLLSESVSDIAVGKLDVAGFSAVRPLLWAFLFWLVSVTLSVFSSLFLNINRSSLHGFYRDRISRAYLFRRTGDGFEQVDRLLLSEIKGRLPYRLVNASVNVSAGQTGGQAKHLAGSVRNADFFLFSPCFVGSDVTGYRATTEMEKCDPHLDLGTATAISGAALAPNMGMVGKPALSMLLAVLNLRLGYWLPNPGYCRKGWGIGYRIPRPEILFKEMLNDMSITEDFVNVTDGGHVENLAVLELIRRQCRVIIACDAEEDGAYTLGGLIKVIRMARIDLGIFVTFPKGELDGIRNRHWTVGTIHYADDKKGYLLYLKLSRSGDEDPVIADYARRNPAFPHESTGDQFFSEEQFEAYRALGYHVAKMALAGSVMQSPPPGTAGP